MGVGWTGVRLIEMSQTETELAIAVILPPGIEPGHKNGSYDIPID